MVNAFVPKVLTFEGVKIRAFEENGTAWFSGRDIMRVLEYSGSGPIQRFTSLPENMRCLKQIDTGGCRGVQNVRFVTEEGVCNYLSKSGRPNAKQLMMWITCEAAPEIKDSGISTAHVQESAIVPAAVTVNASAVRVFTFEGLQLRIIEDENGVIWCVAKDIAQALEYSESAINQPGNLFGNVPKIWADHKRIVVRSENGVEQEREMLCLTEQGVYFFLGRSDKKKALPYQMWIAGDVVPSIRKHGMYATPMRVKDILENPDAFIEAVKAYKAEKEKNAALEAKIEEDKPKVIFAEALETSKNSILIGHLAAILRQNGIDIGQNRLFDFLRKEGYLISAKGERWNMPTQRSLERGLFEVKTRIINNANGSTRVIHTTKVTGKGQIYFINLFKRK